MAEDNKISPKTKSNFSFGKFFSDSKKKKSESRSDYGETYGDYGLLGVAAKATYRAVTGQPVRKSKAKTVGTGKASADFDNSDFFARMRDVVNDELQLNIPKLTEDALENPTGTFKRETYKINQKLDMIGKQLGVAAKQAQQNKTASEKDGDGDSIFDNFGLLGLGAYGGYKALKGGYKLGKKGIARLLAKRATTAAAGATAGIVGKNAAQVAAEATGKTAVREVGETAAKATAKEIGKESIEAGVKSTVKKSLSGIIAKLIGPRLAKMAAKSIPGIGLVTGLGYGVYRYLQGDSKGAAAEIASGAASTVPIVGTAASIVGDIGIAARDVYKEMYGVFPEEDADSVRDTRMKEIKDEVTDYVKSFSGSATETGDAAKELRKQQAAEDSDQLKLEAQRTQDMATRMGILSGDVSAKLEGGIPTEINGKAVPDELYTDEQREKIKMAREMRASMELSEKAMSGDKDAQAELAKRASSATEVPQADLPAVGANPMSGTINGFTIPGGQPSAPISETVAERGRDPVLVIPTTLAAGTYYLTTNKPTKTMDVTAGASRTIGVGRQAYATMGGARAGAAAGGAGGAAPKVSIPAGKPSAESMKQAVNPPTVATPTATPFVSAAPQAVTTGEQLAQRAGLAAPSTAGMPSAPSMPSAMGTGGGGVVSDQGITPRTGPMGGPTRGPSTAAAKPGSPENPIPQPKTQVDPDKIIAGVTSGDIRPTDAVVQEALKMKGLHERSDRQAIQKYLASGGKANAVDPSQTAWCSAFVNASMARAGIQGTGKLAASSWHSWGEGVQDPTQIKAGDVMVRNNVKNGGSGSHVEIATGPAYKNKEGKWIVPTIGGNSGDQVKKNSYIEFGSEGMSYSARRATEANYTPEALAAMKGESKREGSKVEQASKAVEQANVPATGSIEAKGTMSASQKPGEDAMAVAATGTKNDPIPVPAATATEATGEKAWTNDEIKKALDAPEQVKPGEDNLAASEVRKGFEETSAPPDAPKAAAAPVPTPNAGRAIPAQARAPDPMQQMMGALQTFMGGQGGMPNISQPTPLPKGIGDFAFRKGEMPWGMAKTMSRDSQGVTTMFDPAGGAAGIFAGGGQEAFQ